MTDVLANDLFSNNETVPIPAPVERTAAKIACEYCDKTFPDVMGNKRWIANHIKHKHPEHYSGPQPAPRKATAAKKTSTPKKAPTATTRVVPAKSRRPLGESIARVVLQIGKVINTVVDPPTGAAIMFEAGALGEAIDRAIAGSMIDKPLQKGAGLADKFEPLIPLVTLPALTFMLSRHPESGGMLEGELREALEDVLVQSLPLLRKRAARSKATVDALAELRIVDPALGNSDDPIGDILRGFFTAPVTADIPTDDAEAS